MKTKIVTVHFDHKNKHGYSFLLGAFRESVLKNMPDAELQVIELPTPKERNSEKNATAWTDNTLKIRKWIEALDLETNIIFADCDMIVTGDLSTVFDEFEFDIAYTKRGRHSKHPINGGMIFVRANKEAHDFIKLWTETNEKMFADKTFHKSYQPRYGGINQSALGYLLESENHDCNLLALPCEIYNACDESWSKLRDDVKAIHYKGTLRNDVLTRQQLRYPKAIEIWDEYNNVSKMAHVAHGGKHAHRSHADPMTFTEKLFYRKLYDRNPDLITACNIHKSREKVTDEIGAEYLTHFFNDIPGKGLECIIRMMGAERLNMYLPNDRRMPRMEIRRIIEKWISMNFGPQAWGYSQVYDKNVYIEKIIRCENGALPDKITVDLFDEKPEYIYVSQYELQTKPVMISKKMYRHEETTDDTQIIEACEIAAKLCAGFDYMRVEFLAADDRLYFHRFSPYPEIDNIDAELDIEIGEKWFLRTPETP